MRDLSNIHLCSAGMHGMPPFMPPPPGMGPGMGMPPMPPFGMPAPPPITSSSSAPPVQPPMPPSKIGPTHPDAAHEEGRGDYDTDYRNVADYNRGGGHDQESYDYEGGDRYGNEDYRRGGPPGGGDFRSQREDYSRGVPPNVNDDYGGRSGPPPEDYGRDDLDKNDGYGRGPPPARPDFNNRGPPPPHDGHMNRGDYGRGMPPPQNEDYSRGSGSRFDRPPDDRMGDRGGSGDMYGGSMYNGNGVGSHSSVLNSSAAAVANKLGAKTRIIHPDDHQTTSLEERRALMMMSARVQYH